MTKQRQFRRGTTADHSAFTGALGEVTVDTSKKVAVVHDGVTPGGAPQQREVVIQQNGTFALRQPRVVNFISPVVATSLGGGTVRVDLADTGVVAGTYQYTNIVVDEKGRIVSAESGALDGAQIVFSGDISGAGVSGSTIPIELATVSTAGTYSFATIVIDAKGRVLSANASSLPPSSVAFSGDVTGTGDTGTTIALTLADTGTVGTYTQVVTDAKGRVVSGSNPGFLTAETDTLASVTGRGATTSEAITITNTTASSGTATGALIVAGGAGIAGNVNVGGTLQVTGDLVINGTTTTVNSTVTTIDDPMITLGGDTAPVANDAKDRGIEFRYHDGVDAKLGFFGRKETSGRFVFIPDGSNTSEVFAGVAGDIEATTFHGNLAGNADTATSVSGFVPVIQNIVINGDFRVNQRRVSSVTGSDEFVVDRWRTNSEGSALTASRISLSDADRTLIGREDARYALQYETAGGSAVGDRDLLVQRIESVRTFADKNVVLVFYARRSAGTGNLSTSLSQVFQSDTDVNGIGATLHTLTTSWARYQVPMVVPSVDGKTITGGDYVSLRFWISAGSNYSSEVDGLGLQDITVQITDVTMIEADATAASAINFVPSPIIEEQMACMRFFETSNPDGDYATFTENDGRATVVDHAYSECRAHVRFMVPKAKLSTVITYDRVGNPNTYSYYTDNTLDLIEGGVAQWNNSGTWDIGPVSSLGGFTVVHDVSNDAVETQFTWEADAEL